MMNNMRTIWKIILILIAVGLVLAILGLTLGASRALYLDRAGVHISENEMTRITEHDLDPFRNINIDAGLIDVEFVSSGAYGIEISSDIVGLDLTLENDTLTVSYIRSSRVQIMNFDFNFRGRNYVRVFIPNDAEFDIVTVRTRSGDVKIGDLQARTFEVNSTSGNIGVSNVSTDNLQVGSTSGNITGSIINATNFLLSTRSGDGRLQAINAERFSAESTSGDLSITRGELGTVNIAARSGNITANEIISKSANAQTTSGNIRLNGDFSGESVIQARSGDVRVSTSRDRNYYSFGLTSRSGTIRLDGERLGSNFTSGLIQENHINISTTSGNINVSFTGFTGFTG